MLTDFVDYYGQGQVLRNLLVFVSNFLNKALPSALAQPAINRSQKAPLYLMQLVLPREGESTLTISLTEGGAAPMASSISYSATDTLVDLRPMPIMRDDKGARVHR